METKKVTTDLEKKKKTLEILEVKIKEVTKSHSIVGFNPKLDTAEELLN